jgi:predicted alpha-1,2-mannosidase
MTGHVGNVRRTGIVLAAMTVIAAATAGAESETQRLREKLLRIGNSRSFVYAWSTSPANWSADGLKGFREATGDDPLMYFVEVNKVFGTWPTAQEAARNRANLYATIRREWKDRRAVPMVTWHIENPYVPAGWKDERYGPSAAMRYRYSSPGYPQKHKRVVKEILEGTGAPCGRGCIDGTMRKAYPNPRAWYDALLDDMAAFCRTLRDDSGNMIPIVIRPFHECEDDWQWWGAGSTSPAEYIKLFRYTVNRLRRKTGTGNLLFCYSPDNYWKELGAPLKGGFLCRYPGDNFVDMIGFDNYALGKGKTDNAEKTTLETIRKMRLVSEFGRKRGKICGIYETGARDSVDSFYSILHRVMTDPEVNFAIMATYDGPWTFPATDAGKADMKKFLARADVMTGKNLEGWWDADASAAADPFIGTSGYGHLYPGPKWPNGMVAPGPDTGRLGWSYCGGYQYADKAIYGFSQTRISGTGAGELLDVLLQPFTGEPKEDALGIRGLFDKREERATPGYYEVTYTNFGVTAQLTASRRVAYHRYTFSGGKPARILVDLDWGMSSWYGSRKGKPRVVAAESELVGNTGIRGHNRTHAWVPNRDIYYVVEFSRPFTACRELPARKDQLAKRLILDFDLEPGESVSAKVAVSGVDAAGARGNLDADPEGFDFDARCAECRAAWNERLSRAVPHGTGLQRRLFTTSLYHASLEPSLFSDADGRVRGTNGKIYRFPDRERYTNFALWDTFRATLPLYSLLVPELVPHFVHTMMSEYDEIGRVTKFTVWGREVYVMVGDHSVPFLVDSVIDGKAGEDGARVFKAIDATLARRTGAYKKFDYDAVGYYPIGSNGSPCSHTLEACVDDACAARLARRIGRHDRAEVYEKRARFYRNLWDPSTRMFRARHADGSWREPFDPLKYGAGGGDPNFDYTESCALNYKWHVMHDPEDLVSLLGGAEAFVRDLDVLFTEDAGWATRKRDGDCTGLIGEYAHGNEPQAHVPYFFRFAGRGDRTAEIVREICEKLYSDRPAGICGNDDCGHISSWYVFSTMGFYPFDPCGGEYVLGAPQLPAVTLSVNGRKFEIAAAGLSREAKYVREVTRDGRPVKGFRIHRNDIRRGGKLEFSMTPDRAESSK